MAKLLMAATAAAALLAPATVRADTLPREVLGKWCVNPEYGQDSATYERCKNKDSDIALEVKQNSAEFYEEDGCRFTSVATRTGTRTASSGGRASLRGQGQVLWRGQRVE